MYNNYHCCTYKQSVQSPFENQTIYFVYFILFLERAKENPHTIDLLYILCYVHLLLYPFRKFQIWNFLIGGTQTHTEREAFAAMTC